MRTRPVGDTENFSGTCRRDLRPLITGISFQCFRRDKADAIAKHSFRVDFSVQTKGCKEVPRKRCSSSEHQAAISRRAKTEKFPVFEIRRVNKPRSRERCFSARDDEIASERHVVVALIRDFEQRLHLDTSNFLWRSNFSSLR